MKKLATVHAIASLTLLLTSSCYTMRKRMDSAEQHGLAYTHTAFASDSTFRYWYFASDSAFSYHPDSGLRTLSGRLLGWELSVNHQSEEHTVDSTSNFQYSEKKLIRDSPGIWPIIRFIAVLLAVALILARYFWGK
ncbi:hypothetical protein [Sphingobacterium arenae]|uniref:Uncharacterized protein n=1 Tax=Sphingobacterium arenae TaxID=1280598 RepID=A0ABR7Y1N4_9SPHI|nr:hypothetical protein [Sphingobacterium arenae]MBD1425215.1 hypothetical protein [Sphingobacterium arenae]